MERRTLGTEGLEVSAIGLGCWGMTSAYGPADEAESRATLRAAVESGVTFFDTADRYGPFTNEQFLGEVLGSVRDDVVLATKFGSITLPDGSPGSDGSPAYLRQACDASLRRLGVDTIDLYIQHRVDRATPIEETVGAMSELVTAGKVRYIGLSEAGADRIRRAHAVHPLSAVQSELSLWSRDVETDVLPTLRELGIGFVAYSPLGRGFFAGAVNDRSALAQNDSRRGFPRFSEENLPHNLALLQAVEGSAERLGVTTSQIALAWVLAQGEDVVPIPGTAKRDHLAENLGALRVRIPELELAELRSLLDDQPVAGERSAPEHLSRLDT